MAEIHGVSGLFKPNSKTKWGIDLLSLLLDELNWAFNRPTEELSYKRVIR